VSTAREVIVFALHDADCPDTKCDPMVMGKYYRQADRLAAAGFVVIHAGRAAPAMTGLREAVKAFIAQRDDFIRAIKASPGDDADYWRWQGHAEARRKFREALERKGIDVTAEPALVVEPAGKESDT